MATRTILRLASRWFSSNSKVLTKEEKAVENACVKKEWEAEKLKMLARKKELDEKLLEFDAYQGKTGEARRQRIEKHGGLVLFSIITFISGKRALEEEIKRGAQDQVA